MGDVMGGGTGSRTSERNPLLEARLLALRWVIPQALRAVSLPTLFRLIAPRRTSATETQALRAIARSEALAASFHAPNTCLYRAMTRFVGLRSAGVAARFRMGLRRDDPDAGHAWVEVDGIPSGEEADERLIVTYSFP